MSEGTYAADPSDGFRLRGALVINAVRCLPPANKPTPLEIRTCRPFLEAPIAALAKVRVFVALGSIAHDSAVRALGGSRPRRSSCTSPSMRCRAGGC